MNTIKSELIRLGIDPTLISEENLLRLQAACEETDGGAFRTLRECYAAAIDEHNHFANAIADTAHKAAGVLLSLAELPTPPRRGFSASCARMLADLSAQREGVIAQMMCELSALRSRLEEGKQARLALAKERSLLHLVNCIRGVDAPIPSEEELVRLFGGESEAILLRLTALLCELEAFLADFALSAARVAKRVDSAQASTNEYGGLIEGARIRLHDMSLAAEHIRKETDHVQIHTCP